MAQLGRKVVYTTADAKADAKKKRCKGWWDRNKDRENHKHRKEYARVKEALGRTVRKYTPRQEALAAKQRERESARAVEQAVDSPQARAHRTVELTLSRACISRNEMYAMFDGPREEFFNKICLEYINCDDSSQGEENIDRISTRLGAMLTTINQYEHSILNNVGSWALQMQEYQAMRHELQESINMATEIHEVAMVGGKVEVLFRATQGLFAFQAQSESD
ncbi:hypothetical protein BKA70DRAFT_1233275 [Coprinopsis sp. MPI-PUGE-AT-0042]|nr:hypothetical protein BKA70DRAFT_1233275 [Coprinopsis sp. MPI-PUGE-AT-0042]